MVDKKKKGYLAGFSFILAFILFLVFAINNDWNMTGQILWGCTGLFGLLGFGSLAKPESIGSIAFDWLESISKNQESNSTNIKQVQKNSSGVQVNAQDSNVNIYHPSEKSEKTNKPEGKIILQEKRVIDTKKRHVYELGDLDEGEELIGEISSTRSVDIEFLNLASYDRLKDGEPYDCPIGFKRILEKNIAFIVPQDGTWYLVVRNKGTSYTKVRVRLELIPNESK